MKSPVFHRFFLAILLLAACVSPARSLDLADPTPDGQALAALLANMRVTSRWLPDTYVDWRTGDPLAVSREEARARKLPRSSHCSGFAAAVAERLGVKLLNEDDAGGVLLANRQNDWLNSDQGKKAGWRKVNDPIMAQTQANFGRLVLAVFKNPNPKKPGHIAVVMPHPAEPLELSTKGPFIAQAGSLKNPRIPSGNSALTTVRDGFWLHTHGGLAGVDYFVAAIVKKP